MNRRWLGVARRSRERGGGELTRRTARAGFVEHLAKPIPPQDLIESLRRVAEQLPGRSGRGASG